MYRVRIESYTSKVFLLFVFNSRKVRRRTEPSFRRVDVSRKENIF